MTHHTHAHARFRRSLLALAASAALAPQGAWALTLVQTPPGSEQPYVAPNVIISVDDSGSMGYRLDRSTSGGTQNITAPNADGTWNPAAPRVNILKYALKQVFNDTTLLPDGKIRLAWQAMWNNGNSPGVGPAKQISGKNYSPAGATSADSTTSGINSMKVLNGTHRANFISFVNSLTPQNNTPAHWMFSQADNYMRRPLGVNSPWASVPGTTGAPYLGCRRNYHIMMTDGRWNSDPTGGSQDDNTKNKTLPDGTVYGSTSSATRPYNNLYSDSVASTLADWAFYSWATPVQTAGLTGTLQPTADYLKAPATENFGNDSAGRPAVLDRYWNPRYDPATWPHMVTYTIGASSDATTWPGAPTIFGPTAKVPFGYDGSFPDFVTGNKTWPDMNTGGEPVRALGLWHAAINGRCRFYAVNKAEDMEKAFRDIFEQINALIEPGTGSTAASGASITRNEVGLFTAAYNPKDNWKGFVSAQKVLNDGSIVSHPGWGGQSSAVNLDALTNLNNRLILTWNDKWVGTPAPGGATGGRPFKWTSDESNLTAAQKLWLQRNPTDNTDQGATKGQQRLDFIRGDRSLEGSDSGGYPAAKPFRQRLSRQGDIINSDVWYVGTPASNYPLKGYLAFTNSNKSRTPMIYVGGNDGMLHGFSAGDGTETIAYVPRGVIPTLNQLTNPAYNSAHRYFVDGSPMSGDIDLGMTPGAADNDTGYTPDWHTVLIGTLGTGGKGYFVLDMTNPGAFSEANGKALVRLDRTRGSAEPAPNCAALTDAAEKAACTTAVAQDADIGHITAKPVRDEANSMRATQITRMNNNRWAVVLGNGYNSANQRPVLIVQYLDGDQKLKLIPATDDAPGAGLAADNGLASPRLVDLNGDGRTDIVYAGDNQGNLWKFDLTSANEGDWAVAFGGLALSKPLFTARGPASLGATTRPKIQPTTAAPSVRGNDRMMLTDPTDPNSIKAVGGMMVAFGTGRNVAQNDAEDQNVQTLYSVLDNTRYRYRSPEPAMGKRLEVHPGGGSCPNGSDCVPAPAALGTMGNSGNLTGGGQLAKQKITDVGTEFGTVDIVQELKKETWKNYQGWYLDFPAVGERLLKPMEFFDGSNLLTVFSQVPARGSDVNPNMESCDISTVFSERQFRTLINIMDGKRPSVQLVDMNGDGLYNAADAGVSRREVGAGSHTLVTQGDRVVDIDVKNKKEKLARMPEQSLRPSWRQLK